METETNEPKTTQAQAPAYGEAFRAGVSKALEELNKLSFVPPNVRERLADEASKLCLAEALLEHKAHETMTSTATAAEETWRTKLRPDAERWVGKAAEAAKSGLNTVDDLVKRWSKSDASDSPS